MCFENNNNLFSVVISCARVEKQLSTKEVVATRLKIKMGEIINRL